MNEKEKLTENVSTRITKTQKAKLDELDVTLREVIETLSKMTGKKVSKETSDKIINRVKNGKVPDNVDHMF